MHHRSDAFNKDIKRSKSTGKQRLFEEETRSVRLCFPQKKSTAEAVLKTSNNYVG